MNITLTESVLWPGTPAEIWPLLLTPEAVTGFLGVVDDVTTYQPDADDRSDPDEVADDADAEDALHGYTFRVVGLGGGVYHAAFDEIEEPTTLAYAIWRDDTPDAVAMLTFTVHSDEQERTLLAACFAMDMPVEDLFGAFGTVMMPVIEPMAQGYIAHKLRGHLRTLAQTRRS